MENRGKGKPVEIDAPGGTLPLPSFASTRAIDAPPEVEASSPPVSRRLPVVGDRERYEDLGLIARGGMSEVRRVHDRKLGRTLAMKIVEWDFRDDAAARRAFVAEASITAGLQHPGIVAVHDWGELDDGRLWFTMKEVRGRTLAAVIDGFHAAQTGREWIAAEDGWNLNRIVDTFRRACEAVAYAHGHGVIHRDLKPANLMVGEFAEVQVMDWGLALRLDGRAGSRREVAGTPAFMSPEQATGDEVDAASDVYSLGAVLRCALTGMAPYRGAPDDVLAQLAKAPPPPIAEVLTPDRPAPPEALVAIAARAMSRRPADRYPHAGALAAELSSWLEGTQRRRAALDIVEEADELRPEIARLAERARGLREQAVALLRDLPATAPSWRKEPAWLLEEQAAALQREAQVMEVRWLQHLHSALNTDDSLPEAHERLAEHYHACVVRDEAEGRVGEAARSEAFLRSHDRGRFTAFLDGRGHVTLTTSPPGARVTAYRYVERARRLVLARFADLGTSPVTDVELPHGSYLFVLRAPGFVTARAPVHVPRAGRWTGTPPGADAPRPVRLVRRGRIPRGFVHVPAGWFRCGGDPEAGDGLPARLLWVDDFLISRYPVTNAEYVAFLNSLVEAGREEEALRAAPRAPLGVGAGGDAAPLQLARDGEGRFFLTRDQVGNRWEPDWPVSLVDWPSACAYAKWLGERLGLALRLPNELEWEKAGRGVDGRTWPWGAFPEPTWANILESGADPRLAPVTAFPYDTSPYGVRHLAGNVREWCVNVWRADGPSVSDGRVEVDPAAAGDPSWRAARGGSWHSTASLARLAGRFVAEPYRRFSSLGFRLAAPLPADPL